jgi:hypothetical protein
MLKRPGLILAGLAAVIVAFALTMLIVDNGLLGALRIILKYLNP